MLTYEGVGYTEKFARNFDAVVARIRGQEAIEIVDGPDDVCRAWIEAPEAGEPHCALHRIGKRDRLALEAVGRLLGQELAAGWALVLTPDLLEELRARFRDGTLRQACAHCEWFDTCTAAAGAGFGNSLLALRRLPLAPDGPVGPPVRQRIG
ncbi:MAG: DUF1284 domain-containing protein [Ramlibacter sp.]|nr:DUF1284 domain-containing protein [Ramlibacter sp.]